MTALLASGLVSFERLLPFAIFGMFAVCAWLVLDRVARGQSRASERLDEFKNPANRKRSDAPGGAKKQDAMSKVLEKATPALAKSLQPKTELEVSKLKAKLSNGGFRSEAAPSIFLSMKFVGLMVGLVVGGGSLMATGVTQKSLGYVVIAAGGLFYLPEAVLWLMIKSRKQNIFLGLPDALDLMVVCVEAGLGLDQAMRKVAEEMKKTFRVISDEFALANMQLQMGRPRATVLHELGLRTGVDDVRALAAILIQADKFGSSIAQALRVQSDSMRTRRRQLAEEKAAKTAVKLIFPLVLFIFPGIFVVLVGPAAITMVRDMFPKMGGGH
jgi:tight adherence protein C